MNWWNLWKIVKNIIYLDFEEISNYDFPKNELFGLIVNFHDDIKYEFLLNLKNNAHLLIIGSGLRGNQSKLMLIVLFFIDGLGNSKNQQYFITTLLFTFIRI